MYRVCYENVPATPGAVIVLSCLFWALACGGVTARADEMHTVTPKEPDRNEYVSVYVGKSITSKFSSIFIEPHQSRFERTFLASTAYGREIMRFGDRASVEIEANVARRFGDANLWEFTLVGQFRWLDFPWNHRVLTTAGVGIGPSYATKISETEMQKGGGKGSHVLNYFSPEVTFAHPDRPNVEWMVRIHHRSGIFGLINGVSGGSNHVSTGLRVRY
ncbi:MAG: hypothetical protein WEB93_04020 [Sphingomonadales bacterium]